MLTGPMCGPDALDCTGETTKAISLLAHSDRTRCRVQPSVCEERGTPAVADEAAAGLSRPQTARAPRYRGGAQGSIKGAGDAQ